MPCRVDMPRTDYKPALDEVTALLCEACFKLQAAEVNMGTELNQWWEKHKEADLHRRIEAKKEEEAAKAKKLRKKHLKTVKKRLLRQLSPDELEALGVKTT